MLKNEIIDIEEINDEVNGGLLIAEVEGDRGTKQLFYNRRFDEYSVTYEDVDDTLEIETNDFDNATRAMNAYNDIEVN